MKEDNIQPFPEDLRKKHFDIKKITIKPMDWFKEFEEEEEK